MRAITAESKKIWQSPDGEKTIWDVWLAAEDGKKYVLKTYSAHIAKVGFDGDVESYVNKRGDRFVRQKAKAAASAKEGRDDLIRAEWAIGQAINLASVTMPKEEITMPVIERYARDLFTTVGRVQKA